MENEVLKALEEEKARRLKILRRSIEQVKKLLAPDEKRDRKVEQLEAQVKILEDEILKGTATGRWDFVKKKEAEKAKIKGILRDMEAERASTIPVLQAKLEDLEKQVEAISKEVLSDTL